MMTVESSPNSRFNLLRRNEELATINLGGKYALPIEFDSTKLVGGFYQVGQEAMSMENDQPIMGSDMIAPGWQIWRYPDTQEIGGKVQEHPMKGKPHKVSGSKADENFVLMFRPLDVQQQVNEVYGSLSTDMLVAEQRGETLQVGGNDPGMLSNQRLNSELGVEMEIEQMSGRSASLHAGIPSGNRIKTKTRKVAK